MAKKKANKKKDVNELAKSIVDQLTDENKDTPKEPESLPAKNEAAVALGRLGGLKGGEARAKALSPEKRKEIAKKAAAKRWAKKEE